MKEIRKKASRQMIDYFLWGISTTVVNIILYGLFCMIMDYRIANMVAIIVCKIYAYMVNKIFVFQTRCSNFRELLLEVLRYVMLRGYTGIIDYLGVIILVEFIGANKWISKYLITGFVMILNYLFGRYIIFRKQNVGRENGTI